MKTFLFTIRIPELYKEDISYLKNHKVRYTEKVRRAICNSISNQAKDFKKPIDEIPF